MKLERSQSCEVLTGVRGKSHSYSHLNQDAYRYQAQLNERKMKNGLGLLARRVSPSNFDGKSRALSVAAICELPEDSIVRVETYAGDLNRCCDMEQEKRSGETKWHTIRRKLTYQNQRPKKNLMSSIFNDDVEVSPVNNKQSITRKTGVGAGIKDDNNRTLSDLLNHYTFNYFNTENDVDGYENSLEDAYLEESWTDIITEYEGMTSKDKIQQETIWELLITERNYLRKLRVIIMVFKNCLVSLQKENFLEEVDINKLFANIKEVYDTNHTFWEDYLRHVTEDARTTKKTIKPSQLHESFASFEELFQPYIRYCMEEASCMKYLKHLKRENEMFQEYLAWCENHRQCMRLKLADLFVKPMQRVTKYALLLKAILGKTTDEEERTSLENMIFQVDRFVTKINTTLRLRNEQQKLDDVLERIEMYNPIEAANEEMEKLLESHYGNFDLHCNIPGLHEEEQRCILLEGAMKLIEKQGRSDVQVFLFTDVLVLAKAKKGSDKFRIIRQPFRLNKITLHRSKDVGSFILVYLNEYGVLVTAFTLQVGPNEHTKWISAIEKAKKRYENARCAKGSTLDFFDDDLPPSASVLVTSFASATSPNPDRRSVLSDDSRLDPSSINMEELRCRSTEAVTRSYQKVEVVAAAESHVKRSFSDPKAAISYSARERSSAKQKGRPRPKSLVNISDHDIATWVLTNENRNQSGSITSDISDDSQRSSGIGDSFRSINSDGGIAMAFNNLPEVSKVAQLKARFENHGCESPVNTEGSDSSLSTPSVLGFPENSPAVAGSRRVSPPDYMDEHLTIKEEEEQSSNNTDRVNTVSAADSDKDTENSSESLRTINDRTSVSNHSYENFDYMKKALKASYVSTSSQTEVKPSVFGAENSDIRNLMETGVQCELLLGNQGIDQSKNDINVSNDNDTEDISDKLILENVIDDSTQIHITDNVQSIDVTDDSTIIDSTDNQTSVELTDNITLVDAGENITTSDALSASLISNVTELLTLFVDVSIQCNEELIKSELSPEDIVGLRRRQSQSTMTEETRCFNDTWTQCDVALCNLMKDTGTQCGDFIQLTGSNDTTDNAPENIHATVKLKNKETRNFNININCTAKPRFKTSLSDEGSNSTSQSSPFMDMLTQTHRPHQRPQAGLLKHSFSEVNISTAWNPTISHSRSRSDEPQQSSSPNSPEHKHRNSAPANEFPGMRALQTLSESLESSLQHRLVIPCNSKPIVKHYDDDSCSKKLDVIVTDITSKNNSNSNNSINTNIVINSDRLSNPNNLSNSNNINSNSINTSNNSLSVRHNSSPSTSLRKLAIMNNSPRTRRKEPDEEENVEDELLEEDSFNEDFLVLPPASQSSPKLRNRIHFDESGNKLESDNKRFTWHDFDSLAALNRIEQTKYGPSGRSSTLPLNRNLSKSTEIMSSAKKSSLKRSIIKRFTDALHRSDDSRMDQSTQSTSGDDDKTLKRKQKREKKKLKKDQRTKEKEAKKRENNTKSRSSSVSSSNSRNSIPLSACNSHGSQTSSVNSR